MEGLPYDFGTDKAKEEKDKDAEDKPEKPTKIEAKDKQEDKEKDKPKATLSEQLLRSTIEKSEQELNEEPADLTPELEAEASVEHLNEPEITAIAQTIASERLAEVQAEEVAIPTSEDLAAESFLENVQATGNIDQAFTETMEELGEASIDTLAPVEIKAETALPVDPESLIEAARHEISPKASYELAKKDIRAEPKQLWTPKLAHESEPERTKKKDKAEKQPVIDDIVDYVIGRRYGRLNPEASHEEVERRLNGEVRDLELQLSARETHVRQIAQSKTYEKVAKEVLSSNDVKQEIVRLASIEPELVDDIKNEKQTASRKEAAGISAHTMKRSELIRLAEKIKVEDSNLREIFERHLVGEKGLKRIVAEYLRGGDFKKALRRELLEKEKDFERDPKLRDQASILPMSAKSTQLDNLLQQSGIDWSEPPLTILPTKPKRLDKAAIIKKLETKSSPFKRIADVALISLILILAAAIIYVIMKR